MIEFLWDIHQQHRINETSEESGRVNQKVNSTTEQVRALEAALQRISLASQAMWEILQARLGVTGVELLEKMSEIDLRDGKHDGKIGHTVVACPKCSRNVSSRKLSCLFCGAVIERRHVFE
jgi:hypothetical protein